MGRAIEIVDLHLASDTRRRFRHIRAFAIIEQRECGEVQYIGKLI